MLFKIVFKFKIKMINLCYRKRVDAMIAALDTKQDAHREKLTKLQQQFQQEQVKAALKA